MSCDCSETARKCFARMPKLGCEKTLKKFISGEYHFPKCKHYNPIPPWRVRNEP